MGRTVMCGSKYGHLYTHDTNLESRLVFVVDLLQRHVLGAHEVSQLGQEDAIAQALLQLGGGRQLLVDARLHPPATATMHFDHHESTFEKTHPTRKNPPGFFT